MKWLILVLVLFMGCASLGGDSDDVDQDDNANADDDSDAATADDDTASFDDSGDEDDTASSDDSGDDASDDTMTDDDTASCDDTQDDDTENWAPGHWGYFAAGGNNVYTFHNGRLWTTKYLTFEDSIDAIASRQGAGYFATHRFAWIHVYRYFEDGLDMIYEFHEGDMGSDRHVVSMAPYSYENVLLLNYVQPDFPPNYLCYDPFLDIEPLGLFQGFQGGAYPFDTTTLYSYDGSDLTLMAAVPDGTIQAAAPFGDGFIVATEDEILTWDPAAQWTHFADGTALALMTDPDGDLLVEKFNAGNQTYEYYIGDSDDLQLYENFDASSCRYGFLYAGDAKGFFCEDKPADLDCDECWGGVSYLITENSGIVGCQGLPFSTVGDQFIIIW